jgi:hypothetical protein
MTKAGPVYLHDGIFSAGLLIPMRTPLTIASGVGFPPLSHRRSCFWEKLGGALPTGRRAGKTDHVGFYALRNSVHRLVR